MRLGGVCDEAADVTPLKLNTDLGGKRRKGKNDLAQSVEISNHMMSTTLRLRFPVQTCTKPGTQEQFLQGLNRGREAHTHTMFHLFPL